MTRVSGEVVDHSVPEGPGTKWREEAYIMTWAFEVEAERVRESVWEPEVVVTEKRREEAGARTPARTVPGRMGEMAGQEPNV